MTDFAKEHLMRVSEEYRSCDWPLVSVVMPMFNHECFVEAALDSVADQGYPRVELLALDDGSSDNTFSIASRWAAAQGQRLERCVVRRQTNHGICSTLNKLVRESRGDYIQVLASDDLLADGALERLVLYHQRHFDSDDLLFTNVELIDEAGSTVAADAMKFKGRNALAIGRDPRLILLEAIFRWGTPFQHQFYPRAFFDSVGGYDDRLDFEDVYFAVAALARGKARYAPIISKRYRLRMDGAITPGLRKDAYTAVPSRNLGAVGMGRFGRFLVRIANFRDTRRNRVSQWMARRAVGLLYRTLYVALTLPFVGRLFQKQRNRRT